jgi:hypothetical protein
MNEKYLSGIGAGLILVSFGVIVSFFVATGVESKAAEENQTISFEQLGEIVQNPHKTLKNNPTTQEFRKFVGDTVEELKDKAILANSTLYSQLKNSTVIKGTD